MVYMRKRMLFGLATAPTHFRKIVLIVAEYEEDWLVVYIDNILLGVSSYEEVW